MTIQEEKRQSDQSGRWVVGDLEGKMCTLQRGEGASKRGKRGRGGKGERFFTEESRTQSKKHVLLNGSCS
jgi:hypothetical protein